jgi:hypothetical protein
MEITLSQPYEFVLVERRTKTITSLNVRSLMDKPLEKKVLADIEGLSRDIVLWEGASYDAIGQWTDSDVSARLNELFSGQ